MERRILVSRCPSMLSCLLQRLQGRVLRLLHARQYKLGHQCFMNTRIEIGLWFIQYSSCKAIKSLATAGGAPQHPFLCPDHGNVVAQSTVRLTTIRPARPCIQGVHVRITGTTRRIRRFGIKMIEVVDVWNPDTSKPLRFRSLNTVLFRQFYRTPRMCFPLLSSM